MEPDVALKLKRKLKETGLSKKELFNRALRKGLEEIHGKGRASFRVKPHSFGLKPGFDRDKMNQLLDELEVDDYLRQQAHDTPREDTARDDTARR